MSTDLERGVCRFNSKKYLHSRADSRGRSHHQGSWPGATELQPLQREGRQHEDGSDVRQGNNCTSRPLTHNACLLYKSSDLHKLACRTEILLLSVNNTARALPPTSMESKGDLVFKFVDAEVNVPIMMQNQDNPIEKVISIHCYYIVDQISPGSSRKLCKKTK